MPEKWSHFLWSPGNLSSPGSHDVLPLQAAFSLARPHFDHLSCHLKIMSLSGVAQQRRGHLLVPSEPDKSPPFTIIFPVHLIHRAAVVSLLGLWREHISICCTILAQLRKWSSMCLNSSVLGIWTMFYPFSSSIPQSFKFDYERKTALRVSLLSCLVYYNIHCF